MALFVDGDNLSPSLGPSLLEVAERLGEVSVRRVYGRAEALGAWDEHPAFRGVRAGGAKNGTDLLLCIEAVDLASQGLLDAVAIASDDRDFSHLACWMRERGLSVLGLGTRKASQDWRASCSTFVEVGPPQPIHAAPGPLPKVTGQMARPQPCPVEAVIRDVITREGQGGAMSLCQLGHRAGPRLAGLEGAPKAGGWKRFLGGRAGFVLEGQGAALIVRLR